MARPGARYAAVKPSGPTPAVETVNARGVFDSIRLGDLDDPPKAGVAPQSGLDDDDDQATMLYKAPRRANGARHASNFPPPVRVVAPAEPRARRSEMPPPAMRVPAITLESIPARAPRPSITAATESTPAMAFDAESGEHRTPTVPVPRLVEQRSKLPYLAAGVLALAAGALVVLFAGVGKRSYPEAWAAGAAASSAQSHLAAAAPPAQPAAAPVLAHPAAPIAPPSSTTEDRIYAAAFAASYAAAEAPVRSARVAARAPRETPAAAKPETKKPEAVVAFEKPVKAEKPAKAEKPVKAGKGADEEVSGARKDMHSADDVLLDTL